jgi:uncharacterized membrane protein YozB (DUF420 family)
MSSLLIAESILPHVNATLNAIALLLLILGYKLIRAGLEYAHQVIMLTCFLVSIAFLCCYLVYHYGSGYGHTEFDRQHYPNAANFYYLLLATHVPMAAIVPVLAMITIYLGLTDQRSRHKRIAKWTFPIWIYVSISGVLVYVMIYWWFPPHAN